jgi:hypothetical protein
MSPHNVTDEQLVQFVLGELPSDRASEMEAHLRRCASCRQAAGRLQSLLDCAGRMAALPADERLSESANQQVLLARGNEKERPPRPAPRHDGAPIWRIVMRNRIATLAAAALIVVAAIIGLPSLVGSLIGGTITFAEVIQPILHARTVVVDTIIGRDESGPAFHDVVKGARIRRTVSDRSDVVIMDLDGGRMLTLDPQSNSAAYVDIQGPIQEGTRSYLGLVREIVTRLHGRADLPVRNLGRQEVDGREALGFQVSEENTQLTIWAAPETGLPLRIEVLQGQSFTILKNIEFDVPVDDSLVSMDVPAGYTVREGQLEMRDFAEQDFVEALRLWVQLVLDGKFPDSLRLEDLMGQMRRVGEEIGRLDIPGEEKMQLGLRLWRGYTFFHVVAHDGTYHYAGQNVRFGDPAVPVFWYQPQGSATWRIIYADLHVADVAPENLPK